MAGDLPAGASESGIRRSADSNAVAEVEATIVRPVIVRELAAVACWTICADLFIFRTVGYVGPGVFLALVPLLMWMGRDAIERGPGGRLITGLLLLVAMRLVWSGSGWAIFSGITLVIALAMSCSGYVPHVLEGFVLAARVVFDGARRLGTCKLPTRCGDQHDANAIDRPGNGVLTWMLPLMALLVFGSIFVLANPNLLDWVSARMSRLVEQFQLWIEGVSVWEVPFCVVALLIGQGLLRPVLPLVRIGPVDMKELPTLESMPSALYAPLRNTLWTLILLFSVYLSFEFVTLWKRDFPSGFYYAGYAHQGAAWLTFALALATAVLSFAFSGATLNDERVGSLRKLSWVWSAQNLLLAAAVYNRLMIYVGYNGMTQLRTVGFFGTTLVVIGFCLVVYKIHHTRTFWWLIRAQLIALVLTVIAYSVSPVDYLVHRYNATVVRSGYLHPSVMIAVKPKGDGAYFPMLSLTRCEDAIIREGVLALLAERQIEIAQATPTHWTEVQGARELLKRRMVQQESEWAAFRDDVIRERAIEAFRDYAMQWY